MGTDNLGRDLFSRILTGTRSSIAAMLVITVCTLVIGTVMGVVSGYFGGVLDVVVQKILLIFSVLSRQVYGHCRGRSSGGRDFEMRQLHLIAIGWTDLRQDVQEHGVENKGCRVRQGGEIVWVWSCVYYIAPHFS